MTVWWALAVVDRAPRELPRGLLAACGALASCAAVDALSVEGASAALIAAQLDRAPETTLDALRAHDDAVRALEPEVAAIAPVRFGCSAGTREALLTPLRARADAVRATLDRVRDARQITIRARGGPLPSIEPEAGDPRAAALGPGARFLRRRARAASPEIPGWAELASALRALTRAERIAPGDPHAAERWRAYHLVPRDALERYLAEAERVRAAAPDWDLVLGAPSPPYAFAEAAP